MFEIVASGDHSKLAIMERRADLEKLLDQRSDQAEEFVLLWPIAG